MSEDVLVNVEGVSKKFCRDLRKSLLYGIQDITGEMLGYFGRNAQLRPKEFWAIDDVSFELKRGECLGLIGRNGAGKSTLLKMLNGLVKPDKGKIVMRGRVGALIELGAGFNPILTGRENVYINGAVLGFSKKEIDQKFDAIVGFAEIEEFIDMPVQSYSSGMKVRLGFAVAAQMEPDVLIIDEVLAVGDAGFRAKCFNVLSQISKSSAIIIVSHNMPDVARVASKISVLEKSRCVFESGDIAKGIEVYNSKFPAHEGPKIESEKISVESAEFFSNNNILTGQSGIKYGEDLTVKIILSISEKLGRDVMVNLSFFDRQSRPVAQLSSAQSNFYITRKDSKKFTVTAKIPQVIFNPGSYSVSLTLTEHLGSSRRGDILFQQHAVKQIVVSGNYIGFTPIQFSGVWSHES